MKIGDKVRMKPVRDRAWFEKLTSVGTVSDMYIPEGFNEVWIDVDFPEEDRAALPFGRDRLEYVNDPA